MKLRGILSLALLSLLLLPNKHAQTADTTQYWMKIEATDKFQRSVVADTGVSIEIFRDDFIIAVGSEAEKNRIEKLGWLISSYPLTAEMDFPAKDGEYHNYIEREALLKSLHQKLPQQTQLFSIGKSIEGRDIQGIRISGNLTQADQLPALMIMGGHHAREHLSIETALRIAKQLVEDYAAGDARVMSLINHRDIHIIPAINPDGQEYDIKDGRYKMWRKNRRANSNGTYGVDLNRNYGFQWGTGGSSKDPNSDTYMGPRPFSEPETQAVKNYVEAHENISILLSLHTFSQLILYPWGHTYDPITQQNDRRVHEVMAQKMAEWNGYKPQQSSDLYIASGDTTDWSYGEHKIISFTFELDPANNGFGGGGFYPGAGVIREVVEKNYQPILYLLDYADNPYRVLDGGGISFPR
jgi:carboxypeptidase T